MKMNSHDRLHTLQTIIHKWLAKGAKRNMIAQIMVEKFQELGYKDALAGLDICFQYTNDPFNDNRVNTQKIMRWLGFDASVPENRERLFEFEPVMVACLPSDLRTEYLNAVYSPAGVMTVCTRAIDATDVTVTLAAMTKESSESIIAAAELPKNPTPSEVLAAYVEHEQGAAVHLIKAKALKTKHPEAFIT